MVIAAERLVTFLGWVLVPFGRRRVSGASASS
jgi:hypothetical protein